MNKTLQDDYGRVDADTKLWDNLQYQVCYHLPILTCNEPEYCECVCFYNVYVKK